MAIFPSPQTWLGSLGAAGLDVSNLDWVTVNLFWMALGLPLIREG